MSNNPLDAGGKAAEGVMQAAEQVASAEQAVTDAQKAVAAVQKAAAATSGKISLTLDTGAFADAPAAPSAEVDEAVAAAQKLSDEEMLEQRAMDDSMLTEEEKAQVEAFSQQIDVTNTNQVLQYGSGAQAKVASFSEKALENVKTKDLGEVGSLLSGVISQLKGFDVDEEQKGLFGFFKKKAADLASLKTKYDKAEANIDKIVESLEAHQVTLMRDIAMLDQLYELNLTYYKELTMYILAGKKKLKQLREVDIPALRAVAERTGAPEDAQKVNDLVEQVNRFEKKIHDLELTRTICLQMSPQIRLVQNNDVMMSDKIQSTIVNTIPLWKSQMVIALGLAHSEAAAKAQHQVTELTNEMLKKNAEKLKTATITTAQESERGVVDMETLRYTNEQLISTLEEVTRIQDEGRARRREAELEIAKMENDLKAKLLAMKG